jgi:predicted metal-dependent RNase
VLLLLHLLTFTTAADILQVVHEQVSIVFAATAQQLEGYSGASDGRSLRTIVANLAPRALVLIGGSPIETHEMANACKRELPQQQTRVYTPGMLWGAMQLQRFLKSYLVNTSL